MVESQAVLRVSASPSPAPQAACRKGRLPKQSPGEEYDPTDDPNCSVPSLLLVVSQRMNALERIYLVTQLVADSRLCICDTPPMLLQGHASPCVCWDRVSLITCNRVVRPRGLLDGGVRGRCRFGKRLAGGLADAGRDSWDGPVDIVRSAIKRRSFGPDAGLRTRVGVSSLLKSLDLPLLLAPAAHISECVNIAE